MADSSEPSEHNFLNGSRLELSNPSFPGRRLLLRGREASIYCDVAPSLTQEVHSHSQFQLSFHDHPVACTVLRHAATGHLVEQRLRGRQICCVGPDVPHAASWETETPVLDVYFEPAFLARQSADDIAAVLARESHTSAVQDVVLWLFASTLRVLVAERSDPDIGLLETIMLALGRRFFTRHGLNALRMNRGARLSPERLKLVLDYIETHLSWTIHVADLARLVSLGAPHFTEVFGNTVGQPPIEYVRERRFIKAHEMAFSCEHRFCEIADACGFSDGSHLNREFKKFFGYPARALRYRWTAVNDSEKA